jgi:RNA polymerase sigma-70 factor (ECF subfamily)
MLGSFEDSEDLVQETFLRAWRGRASFRPREASSFRSWLYRIATNACLDVLRKRPRRILPPKDTASLLEASVGSVNSALQRARATLRDHLPERRTEWAPSSGPSEEERELLRRYVEAHERADADALAELLREDARLVMPPHPTWYAGREAILIAMRQGFDPDFGQLRTLVAGANMQPAAAHYLRRPGESGYRPLALDGLLLEGGSVAEITSFVSPELFPAFGLPPTL